MAWRRREWVAKPMTGYERSDVAKSSVRSGMTRWLYRGAVVVFGVVLIVAGDSTRAFGVVIVVVGLASALGFEVLRRSGSLTPKEFTRNYPADESETYDAVKSAATSLGYKLLSEDPESQILSFNTGVSSRTWGGQDFTAMIAPAGSPDHSELCLLGATSQRGLGGLQAASWGETKQLAIRMLDRVDATLKPGQQHTTA
jgi:hypothetical protein